MGKDNKSTKEDACDLMMRVSRGDMGAYERLVSLFQKPVINTIYRYIGDAATAEDLAQDVFLKIYKARKRYKPLAKFETWLHRIVFNVVVNESQSRKKRKSVSLDAFRSTGRADADFPTPGASSPVDELKKKELHQMVRDAVLELPPNQRMVLILNKYEDMSYLAISDMLNTSVEAVKSMLFRAREKVRAKLKAYVKYEERHEQKM